MMKKILIVLLAGALAASAVAVQQHQPMRILPVRSLLA